MRAIDLYSGIGGWSAGLRCAGINVVEAYEIWPAAVATYNANLGTDHVASDLRRLALGLLPNDIHLVVGSPPCTEFSYSNRGGGGNLLEGLKDVVRFLEVVEHVRPRYWLMENVPRTATVIEQGLRTEGHPLYRFRSLQPQIKVLNFAEFGLPQSRSRCLVGIFPFDTLESYRLNTVNRDLGGVIRSLSEGRVARDPIWGFELDRSLLTEMEAEPALNSEQLRMNREAKRFHPVYNDMTFPDPLDQPSRTVTATCTRVSRESIVVSDGRQGSVRRLTVRERASLQGFPITYQFYGTSHSQKVKMIGNAVPPFLSYLVGAAAQHRETVEASELPRAVTRLPIPSLPPPVTSPDAVGVSYPAKRQFRAALPSLRFKSGMRFQLSNDCDGDGVRWSVRFFFGPSKDIKTVVLDGALLGRLTREPALATALARTSAQLDQVRRFTTSRSPVNLQEAWSQSVPGAGPYQLVDALGQAAVALASEISDMPSDLVVQLVLACCATGEGALKSKDKLTLNAVAVMAGILLGSWFNELAWGGQVPIQFEAEKSLIA